MSERISLAAVMVLTRFGRIKAAFIPCLLQCKGLVLASKSCSLLPKHPHPKMWGKSHLHAGYSPFNGKHLLVLLLESFAPSIRSLRGPQQPEGCQGNSPRGERCRLCQVSRDWHREHTWSGSTCPGQGRAGLCPRPAQSLGQEQSVHPAPGCPQGEQHPGATGLKSLLASLCRFSCPRPAKDLGPAASGAAAQPWEEQSSSSSAEPQLPHSGAISWEQTFLRWTETEAEVTKKRLQTRDTMQQGWDGPRLLLGPVGAAETVTVPVLAHPCSDTNTDTAAAQLKHEHGALRALKAALEQPWSSPGLEPQESTFRSFLYPLFSTQIPPPHPTPK